MLQKVRIDAKDCEAVHDLKKLFAGRQAILAQ